MTTCGSSTQKVRQTAAVPLIDDSHVLVGCVSMLVNLSKGTVLDLLCQSVYLTPLGKQLSFEGSLLL